jgi:hypothetical protein
MELSIHSFMLRLLISMGVFVLVLGLIMPHIMDVHPPMIVKLLLKPTDWMGPAVGNIIPPLNIGTPEEPFYELTPIHLLAGLALASFCILLYPITTFIALSLLSEILRQRGR